MVEFAILDSFAFTAATAAERLLYFLLFWAKATTKAQFA